MAGARRARRRDVRDRRCRRPAPRLARRAPRHRQRPDCAVLVRRRPAAAAGARAAPRRRAVGGHASRQGDPAAPAVSFRRAGRRRVRLPRRPRHLPGRGRREHAHPVVRRWRVVGDRDRDDGRLRRHLADDDRGPRHRDLPDAARHRRHRRFTATVASFFVQQDEGAEMAAIEARLERIERKLDALAGSGRRPTSRGRRRHPNRQSAEGRRMPRHPEGSDTAATAPWRRSAASCRASAGRSRCRPRTSIDTSRRRRTRP